MHRVRFALDLAMVSLLATAACSNGGDGGHDHDPEHDEASGGVMEGASGPCALPKCVTTFFDQCPPVGAGGSVPNEGGIEYCYSNGVTIRTQPFPAGSLIGSYSVNRADGSNCYIVELQALPEGLVYVYRTALAPGGVKASALQSGEWNVECGGEQAVIPAECMPDMLLLPPSKVSSCDPSTPCANKRGFGN